MKKIIRFIFMFLLCLNLNVSSNKKDYRNYVTNDTVDTVYNYEELLMNSPNEIFQDGYYAGVYFKNLLNNFPLNSHGTCNFVALSMLLSFYDTYWVDSVVPEVYESNTVIGTNNLPMPMSTYSPGVYYENTSVKNILDLGEYQNYIYSTRNTYFQSLLIYLALNNGFISINNGFGMNYNALVAFINFYLNSYNQNTKNRFQILTSVSEGVAALTFAKSMAAQGIPTLLRVGNYLTGKGHTVVAYDNISNGLFVHTGWRKNGTALSHVPIDYLNYDTYYDAIAIVPNTNHVHTNNYKTSSMQENCSCTFMYPQNVRRDYATYVDRVPQHQFDALYKERWIDNDEYNYQVNIKDSLNTILTTYTVNSNLVYIDRPADWKEICENNPDYQLEVKFNYKGSNGFYINNLLTSKEFSSPLEFDEQPYLTPSMTNAPVNITGTAFNNYTVNNNDFSVSYYRTVYDTVNNVLAMSSVNSSYKSFMIFDFDTEITRMDVELGIYTTASSFMTNGNYKIYIAEYTEEGLTKIVDVIGGDNPLLSELDSDEAFMEKVPIYFDHPVKKFAFTLQYTGDTSIMTNTIGQIAINKMVFYNYDGTGILPLSGYELDYNPTYWNDDTILEYDKDLNPLYFRSYYNCYNYALDTISYHFMQPGRGTNDDITLYEIIDIDILLSKIYSDSEECGFTFIPVSRYEICPIGTYKVSLVIDNENTSGSFLKPDYDYHWYRQNSDGTWSHKPGQGKVINTEHIHLDGDAIIDPKTCSRYVNYLYNYNVFVGYFAVSPLH